MTNSNVNGIRSEYRRLTSAETGVIIRMLREGHRIKRAALAADANISEKTLERAEAGQAIGEESCRRIARVLGLREDLFVIKQYIRAPEEAEQMLKQRCEELRSTHRPHSVSELKCIRDVLPLLRAHAFLADDQNVGEEHMAAFAELKQSWWDWNAISSDITEPELVNAAQSLLAEIRSFEARGYVLKSGVSERFHEDGTANPVALLVAFRKPKGLSSTPDEVWLPKKMHVGF
ncbi:MAG: helix-turn-helix transcriptional regulator [Steroidobacteraceae bacterium]